MHNSSKLGRRAKGNIQLDGWYAESFRLSFFDMGNWIQRPLFTELTGAAAAQIVVQPPMQIHQETGALDDANLTVSQQSNRMDIVLSDLPTRNTMNPSLPNYRPFFWIGPYEESLPRFDEICAKATSAIAGARRVAYAVTLINQTSSMQESLARLSVFLPTIAVDSQKDSDLIFQINRPIRDQKHGLINRLARWETLSMATMMLGTVPPIAPVISMTTFGARVYVDISSDDQKTEQISDVRELLAELREQALTIIDKGDSK